MLRTITFRPLPIQTGTFSLGGITWGFELTWNDRTRGPYLDIYRDGVLVISGKRLNVGAEPFRSHALQMGGRVFVIGTDPDRWQDIPLLSLKFYPSEDTAFTGELPRVY